MLKSNFIQILKGLDPTFIKNNQISLEANASYGPSVDEWVILFLFSVDYYQFGCHLSAALCCRNWL